MVIYYTINIDADCRLQIKHLSTYEKCFFYLLVDYKLNPNFKVLILFRQGLTLKLQKLPLAIDIPMCKNLSHFYTTYIIVRFLPLVKDHNPGYKS